MKSTLKCLLLFLFLSGFLLEKPDKEGDKKHLVTVNHPAFGKEDPTEFYLWEQRTEDNVIHSYFLDVQSVICVDHSCKIVPVRVFWDALGNYQRYELPSGVILEKKEGEPFLPEDYEKLHEILMDKFSPYKDLTYYAITREKVVGEGEVDAVTGATAIILDETKTISGAAWTCFTLWHWANGSLVQEIQNITGQAADTNDLLSYLETEDLYQQSFALGELIKRKDHDPRLIKAVLALATLKNGDALFFKNTLQYLEQAPIGTYYQSLKELLKVSSKKRRIQVWNSILHHKYRPEANYFNDEWGRLLESKNYQEINLFLSILEQKKLSTPALIQGMVPLLQEGYSILNRRIYWFLNEQQLTNEERKVLESYFEKYADSL